MKIILITLAIILIILTVGLIRALRNRRKIRKEGIEYDKADFIMDLLFLDEFKSCLFKEDPYHFEN